MWGSRPGPASSPFHCSLLPLTFSLFYFLSLYSMVHHSNYSFAYAIKTFTPLSLSLPPPYTMGKLQPQLNPTLFLCYTQQLNVTGEKQTTTQKTLQILVPNLRWASSTVPVHFRGHLLSDFPRALSNSFSSLFSSPTSPDSLCFASSFIEKRTSTATATSPGQPALVLTYSAFCPVTVDVRSGLLPNATPVLVYWIPSPSHTQVPLSSNCSRSLLHHQCFLPPNHPH